MADLMRLMIPQGWAVSDNKLYDTDPVFDESGFITNWHEGFIEDVLWIQEVRFIDGIFRAPDHHCFDIIIGWYPDSRAGQYMARLCYVSSDAMETVELLESVNRYEIRDRIEYWMKDIYDNYPARKAEMETRVSKKFCVTGFVEVN